MSRRTHADTGVGGGLRRGDCRHRQEPRPHERWCLQAAAAGAELVLFPELSITGFVPNHPPGVHATWLRDVLAGARAMAEPLDGPAVPRLTAIADATGVFVAAGLLEDAGHLLHNTHVLVVPAACSAPGARCTSRCSRCRSTTVAACRTSPSSLGRIGINICFDAFLPEPTRLLAVRGAEIVLFPFAADSEPVTPRGWAAWAGRTLEARCADARAAFEYAFRFRRPELYRALSET